MSTIIPPDLVKKLNRKYKLEEKPYFFDNNSYNTTHCIRINPSKRANSFLYQKRIPWCEEGYCGTTHIQPETDPLFYAGCYCVQDAASMFIAHLLKTLQVKQSPIKVLDISGGRGTLGTLLLDNTHPESLIVVNESKPSALPSLISTLTKWGNANSFVSNNVSKAFSTLPAYFDMILFYSPYLGQAQNKGGQQETLVSSEQDKQKILDCLSSLRTNGILIYASHSNTEEENDEIVKWLCAEQQMEPIRIEIDPSWTIQQKPTTGFYFKNELHSRAFFVTALRKKKEQEPFIRSDKHTHQALSSHNELMKKWIKTDVKMCTVIKNDFINIFPESLINDFNTLQQHLQLQKTGIAMGKFAGDQLIPHTSLAFSTFLHPKIPRKTVSKKDALHLLSQEEKDGQREGIPSTLLTYEGFGIGWS